MGAKTRTATRLSSLSLKIFASGERLSDLFSIMTVYALCVLGMKVPWGTARDALAYETGGQRNAKVKPPTGIYRLQK